MTDLFQVFRDPDPSRPEMELVLVAPLKTLQGLFLLPIETVDDLAALAGSVYHLWLDGTMATRPTWMAADAKLLVQKVRGRPW